MQNGPVIVANGDPPTWFLSACIVVRTLVAIHVAETGTTECFLEVRPQWRITLVSLGGHSYTGHIRALGPGL
jgi:hypothetical protein